MSGAASTGTGEVWVVIGASSSVGRAFAMEAAKAGADIVLAARDLEDIEASAADITVRTGQRAEAVHWDATAFDDHDAFVADVWRFAGTRRLNVFFAAGTMRNQDEAIADFSIARQIVEVNYLAFVSVATRLEPGLRAQKGGKVVVLGSVAGDRGRRLNFVYGSAKAGLHAFLGGWRSRLQPDGVTVLTVKPGFLDTAMTWGQPGLFLVATPQGAAKACLKAANKGRNEIYYPAFWRLIMLIIKSIPEVLFKRLSI